MTTITEPRVELIAHTTLTCDGRSPAIEGHMSLAPQLAEEVIRLREEIDRLKSHLPRTRRPGALVEERTRTTANPRGGRKHDHR